MALPVGAALGQFGLGQFALGWFAPGGGAIPQCNGVSWPTASTTPAPPPPACLGTSWPTAISQNGAVCAGVSWPVASTTGGTSPACLGVSWPTAESDSLAGQQITCVTPSPPGSFAAGGGG